jgi:hypothetical protein
MDVAYIEGTNIDKPEIIQAILLNESVAGRYGPVGDTHFKSKYKRSYGPMQIRFTTGRELVRERYGHSMNDEDLLYHLTHNDTWNIHLARLYYQKMRRMTKSWQHALLAYNVGIGNVLKYGLSYDPNNYVNRAIEHMQYTIRAHNAPKKRNQMLRNMLERDIVKMLTIDYKPMAKVSYHHIRHDLQPYSVPVTLITNPVFRR